MVKEKLRHMPRKPTSLSGLWTAIQEVWNGIDQAKIDRMIDSMGQEGRDFESSRTLYRLVIACNDSPRDPVYNRVNTYMILVILIEI